MTGIRKIFQMQKKMKKKMYFIMCYKLLLSLNECRERGPIKISAKQFGKMILKVQTIEVLKTSKITLLTVSNANQLVRQFVSKPATSVFY